LRNLATMYPINPIQMASAISIYEKSLGGPTFLLLSFFDPLFRALNPRFVKTSYAVVLSPRRDEL